MIDSNVEIDLSGKNQNVITIKLCDDEIEKLFDVAFDGWCPVCRYREINVGETICDSCFEQAKSYKNLMGV